MKQATERGEENEVYLEIIAGTFDELAALVKDDNGTVNEKVTNKIITFRSSIQYYAVFLVQILGETLEILSVIQSWNETVLQEHSSRLVCSL